MPVDIVVPSEDILGAYSNVEKFVITSQLLADDFHSTNLIICHVPMTSKCLDCSVASN